MLVLNKSNSQNVTLSNDHILPIIIRSILSALNLLRMPVAQSEIRKNREISKSNYGNCQNAELVGTTRAYRECRDIGMKILSE